jgi:hypothetical protein
MKATLCCGQPSWSFASNKVEAWVTRLGGHLAPVRFHLPHRVIEPFSIAPWAEEELPAKTTPVLRSLRGDFFCAPFGGNATPYRKERHPAHGESATVPWKFESLKKNPETTELHLSLRTQVRRGRIDKILQLRRGETAVYCRHILSGMTDRMNLGHHATLKFPDEPGSGLISTSRIRFAQVFPSLFEKPANGGYSCLKPGAVFSRLDRVPRADGARADLGRYPGRRGFDDLVMVIHEARPDFAWTAASFPKERYVWFALKDPRVLRSTALWHSNGGRHYAPWSGRHVNVLGMEDVTSYFAYGLAESVRPNPISQRGFPTSLALQRGKPLVVSYIMAVAAIPRGFLHVKSIVRRKGGVRLTSTNGLSADVPLDVGHLYSS